jgi:hypothetical protein
VSAVSEVNFGEAIRRYGYVDITWDGFGRCWSFLGATHLGAEPLFLEVGPRVYNSPRWAGTPRR